MTVYEVWLRGCVVAEYATAEEAARAADQLRITHDDPDYAVYEIVR